MVSDDSIGPLVALADHTLPGLLLPRRRHGRLLPRWTLPTETAPNAKAGVRFALALAGRIDLSSLGGGIG